MSRIREETARCGVTVTDSQIIGLIPEEALANTEPHDLALPRFPEDQILERRLCP
jgi:glutamate formiminotransferase